MKPQQMALARLMLSANGLPLSVPFRRVAVDDDGQCYMIYSAGHVISIEKLTQGRSRGAALHLFLVLLLVVEKLSFPSCHVRADCLSSTGAAAAVIAANGTQYLEFPEYFVEAPVLVRGQHALVHTHECRVVVCCRVVCAEGKRGVSLPYLQSICHSS
jgi:hypothetical protein